MKHQQFIVKIVLGVSGLITLIILCVLFTSNMFINKSVSKQDNNFQNSISEDIKKAKNPIKISGQLYGIEIIEKDTPDFTEKIFVPIKNDYIGKEQFIETQQYTQYSDIIDGVEINVSTIYRYDRITSNEVFNKIEEIIDNNFKENKFVSDFQWNERQTKNGQAFQVLSYKEKTESGIYEDASKTVILKTTDISNIFIIYEFTIHPEFKNNNTEKLVSEIETYLNIT